MGACDFVTEGVGKDPVDAFTTAVKEARWEFGHGGYTGTIAEKGGFVLIPRPARVSTEKAVRVIMEAVYHRASLFHHPDTPKAELNKWERQAKKAYDQVVAWYGSRANSIIEQFEDKWGHALAMEADPATVKKMRSSWKWSNRWKRGYKGYIFFGMASS